MYDTSFPLCVRRTHLTGSRVFHRAKQTYLLQTSSARKRKKKRERGRGARDQLDIYLGWRTRSLLIRWINFFRTRGKATLPGGNSSLGRRTLDQSCASRMPFLVAPPSHRSFQMILRFGGKRRDELLAALEADSTWFLGIDGFNNESNYKANQNRSCWMILIGKNLHRVGEDK